MQTKPCGEEQKRVGKALVSRPCDNRKLFLQNIEIKRFHHLIQLYLSTFYSVDCEGGAVTAEVRLGFG